MAKKPIDKPHPLPPDFDLIDSITFRRDLLLEREGDSKEERLLKRFTIVLGLGMNELKDIDWAYYQLTKLGPPKEKKHRGQYFAMSSTFNRITAGIIVELGNSIAATKEWGLLESRTFREAFAKLSAASRRTWNATVFSFTKREGEPRRRDVAFQDRVITLMKFIRNNTFHFGHRDVDEFKSLAKGYELQFTAPADEKAGTDHLYVSLGNTQEQTRFYFADAAIIALVQRKTEELNVTAQDIRSFVRNLLNALRYLVEALLKHFDALSRTAQGEQ